jgi:serine/threonine protein kinase
MRDILPPDTVLRGGTYQIDYALGRGGFGITYRGHHTALKQSVAIKEFYPQEHVLRDSTTGGLMIPTSKQEIYQRGLNRFLREGQTLAKLNHPHVVRVQDFFQERNTAYLVMELITGSTLKDELEKQPDKRFSISKIETIMSALVGALATVHQQEIYHLDLKPDNVLITPENRLVIVDFGASRQGLSGGTTSQAFTLDYAPPEVLSGKNVGAASDLFELGMMLYEMLTGKLPIRALDRILNDTWKADELSQPWQSLLASALQLNPVNRPQNVQQWWEDRLHYQAGYTVEPTLVISPINPTQKLPVVEPTFVVKPKIGTSEKSGVEEVHPDDWSVTKKGGIMGFIRSLLDDK